MKLTDLDAEFISEYLRADVLEALDLEPTETVHGVHRYDTKAGSFFVPADGTCRVNKALDALYKTSVHANMGMLQTAFVLVDEGRQLEV